jgi:hypothetical protein
MAGSESGEVAATSLVTGAAGIGAPSKVLWQHPSNATNSAPTAITATVVVLRPRCPTAWPASCSPGRALSSGG